MTRAGTEAVIVAADPLFDVQRDQIARLAIKNRLPTIYSNNEASEAGGLMSYGSSSTFTQLIAGDYAGRILKGEKPADLPVVQPATFELVINLNTAKALGLDFPVFIAARATEVIE